MNIIVLGTTQFTIRAAESLLENGCDISAMVNLPESLQPENSADIAAFSKLRSISYWEVEDINTASSIKKLKTCRPDYIFVSWPKILKPQVINIPRFFCIGTHPTDLPHNRGRHPLHWLITQRLSKTKLTFFCLDEGVDTGDLLLQVPITINSEDTVTDLNMKMEEAVSVGIGQLIPVLEKYKNDFEQNNDSSRKQIGQQQNQEQANYWRKKTAFDVTLDLRLSGEDILAIVRSFTRPYPCSNLVFQDHVLKIVEARFHSNPSPIPQEFLEPGRILSVYQNRIVVKCGDSVVELISANPFPQEMNTATYIHPPTKYLSGLNKLHECSSNSGQ